MKTRSKTKNKRVFDWKTYRKQNAWKIKLNDKKRKRLKRASMTPQEKKEARKKDKLYL